MNMLNQCTKNGLKKYFPVILFFVVWISVILFDYKYGKAYLDSDMASEMVLATQLNKEGVLLSKNWFYSTELRILGNAILFKPLLRLFPNNFRLVRTFAQAILLFLTSLSYYYLSSVLKNKRLNVYFATIMICPFGFWFMWHGTFSGCYLIWIIAFNFCGGLIYRIALVKDSFLKKTIRFALLILFSFIIGLQSARGLLNLQMPLFIASIILCMKEFIESNYKLNEINKLSSNLKLFFTSSLISTVFSSFGYLINTKVLSKTYSYVNYNNICWKNFSLQDLLYIAQDFLKLFGYPCTYIHELNVRLFSLNGILSLFGLGLMGIVLLGLIKMAKNMFTLNEEKQIITVSSLMAIVIPFMVFVLFKYDNASYFLPGLGLILLGLEITYNTYEYKNFKPILNGMITLCIFFSSINTWMLFLKNPPRSNAQQVTIANLLVDNGYTSCLGKFWSGGNVITELTNGKVEAWIIDNFKSRNIFPWLQTRQHLSELPQGKCVIIVNKNECETEELNTLKINEDEILYFDDTYVVFTVENVKEWLYEK